MKSETKEFPQIVVEGKFYRVKTGIRNYLNSVFTNEREAKKALERYNTLNRKAYERQKAKEANKKK